MRSSGPYDVPLEKLSTSEGFPAMRRYLVAGNWKMNTDLASATQLAKDLVSGIEAASDAVDLLVCPPAIYLSTVGEAVSGTGIALGGQDAWHEKPGAYTGEIAVEMLRDVGCSYVIVGHSERRSIYGESDQVINAKLQKVLENGLQGIFCIGETLDERKGGQTLRRVGAQLKNSLSSSATAANTIIAYEPVWAIGTGLTPTPSEVRAVHRHIRKGLLRSIGPKAGANVPILYGGSVKPANAEELMGVEDVNGALVGGASLKAADFIGIIKAYA